MGTERSRPNASCIPKYCNPHSLAEAPWFHAVSRMALVRFMSFVLFTSICIARFLGLRRPCTGKPDIWLVNCNSARSDPLESTQTAQGLLLAAKCGVWLPALILFEVLKVTAFSPPQSHLHNELFGLPVFALACPGGGGLRRIWEHM